MSFVIEYARIIMEFWRAPNSPKKSDAVRFGLIGASTIAPIAVIVPAKSHPEVIIAAVAARDQEKASKYAKRYGIPIVHNSYQDLLDDPTIDAVYIALPNSHHYEWATKALKANKHVLLEKPSTSNAIEATSLFKNPKLAGPNALVCLEAIHTKFHPAWQTYLSLLGPPNITYANASLNVLGGFFSFDDIRFIYDLSGGALMDLGAYATFFLRNIFGVEPEECIEATAKKLPAEWDQKIDRGFDIKWRFLNDATGEANIDLGKRGGYRFPWLTKSWPSFNLPNCVAVHREVILKDDSLSAEQEHVSVKKITMWNPMAPHLWHRIDTETTHTIRNKNSKNTIKTWKEMEYKKAYTFPKERGLKGDATWPTYRWMLEEFVNKIKDREGSGVWMDAGDSIKQMAMIDSAYEKSGLPIRPTSTLV